MMMKLALLLFVSVMFHANEAKSHHHRHHDAVYQLGNDYTSAQCRKECFDKNMGYSWSGSTTGSSGQWVGQCTCTGSGKTAGGGGSVTFDTAACGKQCYPKGWSMSGTGECTCVGGDYTAETCGKKCRPKGYKLSSGHCKCVGGEDTAASCAKKCKNRGWSLRSGHCTCMRHHKHH